MEAFVHRHMSYVPPALGAQGAVFRLHRLSDRAPGPGPLDLLRCAWQHQQLVQQLNPFLSPAAAGVLHKGVLLWLQLCVLEDRLGQLAVLAEAGTGYEQQLMQVGVAAHWYHCLPVVYIRMEGEGAQDVCQVYFRRITVLKIARLSLLGYSSCYQTRELGTDQDKPRALAFLHLV